MYDSHVKYVGATWGTIEAILDVLRVIDTATVNQEILGTTRERLVTELVTLMSATVTKGRDPVELVETIEIAVGLTLDGPTPTIVKAFKVFSRGRLAEERRQRDTTVMSSKQAYAVLENEAKPRCPAMFRYAATKNRNKVVVCVGPPMHAPPHTAYPPNRLPVTWTDDESWVPAPGRRPSMAPAPPPPALTLPRRPRQRPTVESSVPSIGALLGSMLAPGAPDRCESATLDRRDKKPGLDPLPLVCHRAVGHTLPHVYYPVNGPAIEWNDDSAIQPDR